MTTPQNVSEVEKVLDDVVRPSAIKLMAGEMTAGETRTALAVAKGIASKVRSAMAIGQTEERLRLFMVEAAITDKDPDLSWHDRQNRIKSILRTGGNRNDREAAAKALGLHGIKETIDSSENENE